MVRAHAGNGTTQETSTSGEFVDALEAFPTTVTAIIVATDIGAEVAFARFGASVGATLGGGAKVGDPPTVEATPWLGDRGDCIGTVQVVVQYLREFFMQVFPQGPCPFSFCHPDISCKVLTKVFLVGCSGWRHSSWKAKKSWRLGTKSSALWFTWPWVM